MSIKEFKAKPEITLQMSLNQQQLNMFNEWSACVPTIYILDICVVSATKLSKDQLSNQSRKSQLIKKLRYLDRPHNSFSYFFALMEKVSNTRGKLTVNELKNQVLNDIRSLRVFFKNANVIEKNEFLISFLEKLIGKPIEEQRDDYLSFLVVLNNKFKLQHSISYRKRIDVAEQIILLARELTISVQHPVVIIVLASLYNNKYSKRLLKLKDNPDLFDAENSLADIMLITRMAKVKLEVEHYGTLDNAVKRVIFITDDIGLNEILSCFKAKQVKNIDTPEGRESEVNMNVELERLLTDIKTEDYQKILNLLSGT